MLLLPTSAVAAPGGCSMPLHCEAPVAAASQPSHRCWNGCIMVRCGVTLPLCPLVLLPTNLQEDEKLLRQLLSKVRSQAAQVRQQPAVHTALFCRCFVTVCRCGFHAWERDAGWIQACCSVCNCERVLPRYWTLLAAGRLLPKQWRGSSWLQVRLPCSSALHTCRATRTLLPALLRLRSLS